MRYKAGKNVNSKRIARFDKITDGFIQEYDSLNSVELKKHGWKAANICMCLTKKNKTAYGFKWRYIN